VEAHTNGIMIQHAKRVIVVADSSKIGKITFARICGVAPVDELVTDVAADPDAVKALTEAGVRVSLV
jgi:DeoR family transcriptional regulator of aga operon